jgi:LruC domain-containing protein
MKRKHLFFTICVLVLSAVVLSSCKRDMFDPEAYRQLIEKTAPIGDIDPQHTWELVSTHTITLQVGTDVHPTQICILSGNPNLTSHTEILAEQSAQAGQQLSITFLAPSHQREFMAAVVTSSGEWLMKAFTLDDSIVMLDGNFITKGMSVNQPDYQTFTYCFEENYPQPSDDWDFNDLVLRIQKLPGKQNDEVRLRISLAAVGAKKQLAAAIRLVGFNSSDIQSVTIEEEGRTFDNYSIPYNQKRQLIEQTDLLLSARSGEAVLNLFEDAHWVMSPRLQAEGQGVVRMYYNTVRQVDGYTSAQMRAKTLTYVVKFNSSQLASDITLEHLDPFVIEDFNSGKWEVHAAPHKTAAVLRDYGSNETATSNNMVWALKIPNGSFRWAQEGINLGYYKDGILTGAYMENDHSFGQWVQNHENSLDWFLYPTTGMVF